jgi:hypothetical protein
MPIIELPKKPVMPVYKAPEPVYVAPQIVYYTAPIPPVPVRAPTPEPEQAAISDE